MLLQWEKHWISSTIQFKFDGEFLGMISRIVRSSTYFARLDHVLTRSFTITENSTGPNLVPWGMPPFKERILEKSEPMRTDCERPSRKASIHLTRQECRLQECNLLKRMVWSIRSNPFLKSAKKKIWHYSYHYLRLRGPGGLHMQLHAALTFQQLQIVCNQDLHKCQGVTLWE